MAVRNEPPMQNSPPLTPCIKPNQIPIDSVQHTNGNIVDFRPNGQRNDSPPGPPQISFVEERGFPVIQREQVPRYNGLY